MFYFMVTLLISSHKIRMSRTFSDTLIMRYKRHRQISENIKRPGLANYNVLTREKVKIFSFAFCNSEAT